MKVPYEPTTEEAALTSKRKDHHLDLCLEEDVEGRGGNGFQHLRFTHNALPELSLEAVDTSARLFGVPLRAPLVIGAMTGGSERAGRVNAILADAAAQCGIALALGSQRAALQKPELLSTYLGGAKPPLRIGNVGAVQLNYGVTLDDLYRLARDAKLDALALHLNPLQEAIQPEGDTNFSALRDRIEKVVRGLDLPIILKEVGSGISEELASWASSIGVAAIETAGVGGTSWAAVEGFRGQSRERRLGEVFRSFGLSTASSLRACRRGAPEVPTIASGGMRSGLDGAKSIAMGARAFAMARPFLTAASGHATHSEAVESVVGAIECVIDELRIAMFCTGSADLAALEQQSLTPALSHF